MATKQGRVHPAVYEAQYQLEQGRISRREFLRLATLLGISTSTAYVMAACSTPAATTVAPPTAAPSMNATQMPTVPTSAIKRGGTLRVGAQVQAADHPARFSWVVASNVGRHFLEYLTETGSDNVTRPLLLKSWEVSDDLKTWTLNLRPEVKWSNGDEFVAEDVVFNFEQWLDPDVGSSMLGLFQGFLTLSGIEVVDKRTVRLHLDKAKLDVPENLFHYPAQIVHHNFDGDFTSGRNPGTGPFTLKRYVVGEIARLVRREGYWQVGADGETLPYLDAIEYIDMGEDKTPYVTALLDGELDSFYELFPEEYLALRDNPKVNLLSIGSSDCEVVRMRADMDPWKDNRVRLALKKCQQRQSILDQTYFGEGDLGHDAHVAPSHPEYAKMDIPAYDPEGAKQLLAEAGYPNGLDVSLAVGTGWTGMVAIAETLKQDAKAAGFNITLNTMPTSAYWDVWTQVAFGITGWSHRPLAVMVLPLAYAADDTGKPVPWNETHWVDAEFNELLQQAQGTVDIEARRAIMAKLEKIQMERGSIGIAYFKKQWAVFNKGFQNVFAHPTRYDIFREVWYDPAKDPFKS